MFSWLGDILGTLGESISSVIFDTMLRWFYDTIYGAAAAFLAQVGSLGTEIFDLDWVQAFVRLFGLLAWALYATGVVVVVFDVAIEYQTGRANLKTTALNVLKGFFACSLIGELPIALYKFCITLQGSFLNGIVPLFSGSARETLAETGTGVLVGSFFAGNISSQIGLVHLLCLTAFLYCFVKLFFANIKRGGILLTQIAVGSLYLFSVPRGYTDGFNQWMRQVVALCLTAFLQTTLLYVGLLTFRANMFLGLGIMLAASEVPRIAQQFGLDTSVKVNMMSVVHATTTAVNLTRSVAKAAGK